MTKARAVEIYKKVKPFITSFIDKDLTLFAASLSFYTIFTIIPLLLIMLTLLTSLPSFAEHYETIKVFIFSNLMPVNSEAIMGHIDGFLKNSAKMGVIGLAMILVASLLFFKNFEYIANKIIAKPITPIFAEFFKKPSICPIIASEFTGIKFENMKVLMVS